MRRRVLLASRTFPPEVNAAAFRLGALARAIAGTGASVDVVTSRPPRGRVDAPMSGVRLHRFPVLRDRGGNVRGYVQYMSFDLPLLFRVLFRRFDIAISEAPPTTGVVIAIAAALRRRPFVYYAADVWTDGVAAVGAPRIVMAVMRTLERFVLRRSQRILSVSKGVTERLVALGAAAERIAEVGHGIDTAVFHPSVDPTTHSGLAFVYTGTMSEVHRPQIFIEAFARIAADEPDVRLRFFGQGVFEQDLRRLADELVPGRVDFGGVIPPEDAAQEIRGAVAALVSLAPGVGYDYAHPTKAYAAAACGTPILFTGVPQFGALITDAGLGESADFAPDAVADSMRTLLKQCRTGRAERLRTGRAAWAEANVSLRAVGERGADAVLTAGSASDGVSRST